METQQPLNQTRNACRQSFEADGKNAKIKIDWKKRVLYERVEKRALYERVEETRSLRTRI